MATKVTAAKEQLFLQDAGSTPAVAAKKGFFFDLFSKKKPEAPCEKSFSTLLKEYVEQVAKAGSDSERIALRADALFDRIITLTHRRSKTETLTDKDWKAHLQAAKKLILQELQKVDPSNHIALPHAQKGKDGKAHIHKKTLQAIEKTFQENISRAVARQQIILEEPKRILNTLYFNPQRQQGVDKSYANGIRKGFFSSLETARKAYASVFLEYTLKENMQILNYAHDGIEITANDLTIVYGDGEAVYAEQTKKAMKLEERIQEYVAILPAQVPAKMTDALFDQIVEIADKAASDTLSKKALADAQRLLDQELAKKKVAQPIRSRIKKEFRSNIARAAARKAFEGIEDPKDLRAWLFMPANQPAMQKKQKALVDKGFFRNVAEAHGAIASAFAERALAYNMKVAKTPNVTGLKIAVQSLKIRNATPLALFI